MLLLLVRQNGIIFEAFVPVNLLSCDAVYLADITADQCSAHSSKSHRSLCSVTLTRSVSAEELAAAHGRCAAVLGGWRAWSSRYNSHRLHSILNIYSQ